MTLYTCVTHDSGGTISMPSLTEVLYNLDDNAADDEFLDAVVISSPFEAFTEDDTDALTRAMVDRGVLIVLLLWPGSLPVGHALALEAEAFVILSLGDCTEAHRDAVVRCPVPR